MTAISLAQWQPRIGFIGLGDQGAPIAERLIQAGYHTTLWARRPESLTDFKDSNAHFTDSPEKLGAASDLVGICVLDDTGTRQVVTEVLKGMAPGGMIAIHSTVHPQTCRDLAEQTKKKGVTLLDAPVSGGNAGAKAGSLTMMIGGDTTAATACIPVFESFASHIEYLGNTGAGQVAKLLNNSLMAANLILAHHAIETGQKLGLDRQGLASVISTGSGGSFALDIYKKLPDLTAFSRGAKLLRKDIALLSEIIESSDDNAAKLIDQALLLLEYYEGKSKIG